MAVADDLVLVSPDGRQERLADVVQRRLCLASYAPLVARAHRGLPALPGDRRRRPRRPGEGTLRGLLLDGMA